MTPEPLVTLVNAFARPFDNAVATARTCYSSRVVLPEEVSRDDASRQRRDAIAQSIYLAGHHTTLQHASFQFALEKVSRLFIWSFLHSHPFYNSEQVSQRYVEVKPGHFTIPSLRENHQPLYVQTVGELMESYQRLGELLKPAVVQEYHRLFPQRSLEDKRWQGAVKKRCQEVARYVLPVATHAHLYHTVSGLTLHRYHRLCRQFDVPEEQQAVVGKMIAEVHRWDPDFFKHIEDPLPLEQTLEYQWLQALEDGGEKPQTKAFVREFDGSLKGYSSRLVDYKLNAEKVMAQSIRNVLGLTARELPDAQAIDRVLNPASHRLFSESLNLTTLGKLSRTLGHPHFTFRRKISHTADSQDQRHRMTPASRPVLVRQVQWNEPDYIVPSLVAGVPEALELYRKTMDRLWERMRELVHGGETDESVSYLLPNAFPIRFEESGDLLNYHHKWTHRLCYTAQEEIWKTSQEEVLQVQNVFPLLGKYFGAPCWMRQQAAVRPFCPEGDRYCGVTVWKLPVSKYSRIL